ncbi:MAG: N(4)-(beta-N-acetylglucosaminyl)-L-asparaginase [Bacteroidetes bacterium]|nr:N(4)-(beta-N-acetylglucosaminyl)-L-asparaginase [Bacteroidota bacterium]
MQSRRKFIRSAALGSVLLKTGNLPTHQTQPQPQNPTGQPIVISTWDFGKTANVGAWDILSKSGRALDAVENGVKLPEADPNNQTIGYGGLPDRDGFVTLDASIMDEKFNCGSVLCLENILHPISVARLVMEKTPHIFLAGEGALQFALANGFKKKNLLTPKSKKDWQDWLKSSKYKPETNIENRLYSKETTPAHPTAAHSPAPTGPTSPDHLPGGPYNHDTIGMLAMDSSGNLSGACTTSGLAYKMHGRVGDSPIIGAGLYVDNEAGAASASGVGEEVIRVVGAHLVVEALRNGLTPEEACKKAVERIVSINPEKSKTIQVGFIALSKNGQYGGYSIQPGFSYSVRNQSIDQTYKAKSFYQ